MDMDGQGAGAGTETITAQQAWFDGPNRRLCLLLTNRVPTLSSGAFYSSNAAVVSVPATLLIPADGDGICASATVTRDLYDATVVLSGSYGGREVTTVVDVAPAAAPSSLFVNAYYNYTGNGSGIVYLNAAAPAGGVTLLLGSGDPSALSVPTSVLVPEGTNSASFSFSTLGVPSATFASLTATSAGVTVAQLLNVQPPRVSSLSLSPASVQR